MPVVPRLSAATGVDALPLPARPAAPAVGREVGEERDPDEEPLEAAHLAARADVVEDDVGQRGPGQQQEAEHGDPEAVDRTPDHAGEDPREDQRDARADQGEEGDQAGHEAGDYARARISARRGSAMLRPVTTTAAAPSDRSTRPAITAATAAAPAPSATMPCARARKRIASSISASDTCTTAATWSRTSSNVTAPGSMLPARPSASVSPTSIGVIRPAASAAENAGERSGSTATTRVPGRAAAHRPSPDARPPPPSGQITVTAPGSRSSSSRPIVDCPAITPVSLYADT